MTCKTPRIVVAGLSGDSGKTMVTLGLVRALARRGLSIAPYKKGPDYIDAAWLGAAAHRPGRNLDTFLMSGEAVSAALQAAGETDLLIAEGNRGLHDGMDAEGSHSTAELAWRIGAPVILVVDVTKMTRTAAALVLGAARLDPRVPIAGVILNRVATRRQEQVIRAAMAAAGTAPVIGAIPRLDDETLPSRHLGLVTAVEHPRREEAIDLAAELVAAHVDLEAVRAIARAAPPLELGRLEPCTAGAPVRIGVFRDAAFSFYYPENLEALERRGASLLFLSPLTDRILPPLDALYIGGGFPEIHAPRLSANAELRGAVREAVEDGLPVWAECGGLIYLSQAVHAEGRSHEMAGALDATVELHSRPQGHGYEIAVVDQPNAFLPTGTRLAGHEFHYTRLVERGSVPPTAARVERGVGVGSGRDGLVVRSVWASYLHVHALGTPVWADALVAAARRAGAGHDRACASCG